MIVAKPDLGLKWQDQQNGHQMDSVYHNNSIRGSKNSSVKEPIENNVQRGVQARRQALLLRLNISKRQPDFAIPRMKAYFI